jgi:hypothetical protein
LYSLGPIYSSDLLLNVCPCIPLFGLPMSIEYRISFKYQLHWCSLKHIMYPGSSSPHSCCKYTSRPRLLYI